MNTIVIPCYNEQDTVGTVIQNCILQFGTKAQILVVDNNSTDNSRHVIYQFRKNYPNVEYHFCQARGKSQAIISVIPSIKHETVVLQDADLEYDLKDVASLLKLHKLTDSDMTIGVRSPNLMLYRSRVANSLIKTLFIIRYGRTLEDVLTGARIINKKHLAKCKTKQFGLETELSRMALAGKLKVYTGKCNYTPRVTGKKIKATHIFELVKVALS